MYTVVEEFPSMYHGYPPVGLRCAATSHIGMRKTWLLPLPTLNAVMSTVPGAVEYLNSRLPIPLNQGTFCSCSKRETSSTSVWLGDKLTLGKDTSPVVPSSCV